MASRDKTNTPIASLLTSAEQLAVMRAYAREREPDSNLSRAEYNARLRVIAARLYPAKVEVAA